MPGLVHGILNRIAYVQHCMGALKQAILLYSNEAPPYHGATDMCKILDKATFLVEIRTAELYPRGV